MMMTASRPNHPTDLVRDEHGALQARRALTHGQRLALTELLGKSKAPAKPPAPAKGPLLDMPEAAHQRALASIVHHNGKDYGTPAPSLKPMPRPTYYANGYRPSRPAWGARLNAWMERRVEQIDWVRFDIIAGNILGVTFTGVVLYLAWCVLDAWRRGAFDPLR